MPYGLFDVRDASPKTKESPITNKVPPPKKISYLYPPAIGGIMTITSPSLS